MTYFGVLAQFIGPPLFGLGAWAWLDARRGQRVGTGLVERWVWRVLGAHVVIALVYTTPWDNYLVATGVWWYDETLVTGITLGWVPVEEYVFFVVQTLMVGLWFLALSRHVFRGRPEAANRPALRSFSTVLVGLVWAGSVAILAAERQPGTYLGLELAWGLPPIMVQLAFGADILWARRRLAAAAIVLPATYLCLVDALAIESGTWTIDPAQSTQIMVAGGLPIEEVIFFFLTTTLIVFGMTLVLAEESQPRAARLAAQVMRMIGRGERSEDGEKWSALG